MQFALFLTIVYVACLITYPMICSYFNCSDNTLNVICMQQGINFIIYEGHIFSSIYSKKYHFTPQLRRYFYGDKTGREHHIIALL